MATKQVLEPLRDMAVNAVADNPELKARMIRLVNMMLDEVEWTFRYGDATAKAVYTRTIVPTLIRSMSDADAGATQVAQREAFERVMTAVRGEGGPAPPRGRG